MPTGAPALSACALAVAAALSASVTTARALAADNDTLIRTIHDLCVAPRGTVDDSARLALRTPFGAKDMGADRGPPYVREVGMVTIGTIVRFEAAARGAPVAKCTFNSYSDDTGALAARMRSAWGLAEPFKMPVEDNGWQVTQAATVDGRAMTVDLYFNLQSNTKAGTFLLTLVDAGAMVNDTLLQAIRELCIRPHGSVAQTARVAMRAPFNGGDLGPLAGSPYAHRIALMTLGRGRTRLMFIGQSPSAPVHECQFDTSASYDLRDLIARLRAALALPEATQGQDPRFWRVTARSSALGPPIDVDLTYALQGNAQLDLFHLAIKR
jgi:hypothetical protein